MTRVNYLPFIKLDDNLKAVLGTDKEMIQTSEVLKRLFAYIKKNGLKINYKDVKKV